jgi:tetratricopeptide (TPR) repeat protein
VIVGDQPAVDKTGPCQYSCTQVFDKRTQTGYKSHLMKKYATLIQEAIAAAKNQDWELAVEINNQILERSGSDLGALNRLGLAYIQLNKPIKARQAFKAVLEKDKSNLIAKKHLANLKNKNGAVSPVSNTYFIEEPGKTKIAELHRLAQKNVLSKLRVGEICQLVSKKDKYLSVETQGGKYIGALPDDLSFRLNKLIKRGNEYLCLVHSFTESSCSVHLQETKASAKNKHLQSFPVGRLNNLSSLSADQEFLIEDDIPVETGEHEDDRNEDFQNTLEKINKGEDY